MITNDQMIIPVFMMKTGADATQTARALAHFEKQTQFAVSLIEPQWKDDNTKVSVWKTMQYIIQSVSKEDLEYIIICRDNTRFTEEYSFSKLLDYIEKVKNFQGDVLFGSVGLVKSTFKITENIYWAEGVAGLPFTVVFRACFDRVLNAEKDMLNDLNQFFIYPFITKNLVDFDMDIIDEPSKEPFTVTTAQLNLLDDISSMYDKYLLDDLVEKEDIPLDDLSIPTYIINLPERTDRLAHIKSQFEGKSEFDVHIIEACKHEIGAVGLWESVRKIIKMAIDNDDDVIIIVEDDHEFTASYSKEYLLKNILDSHRQQVELLLGGIGAFNKALPITENRAWISFFLCTQFVVLFKPAFQKILDAPYDSWVIADGMLSDIVINKMVLYPLISVQRLFGYSDATEIFNVEKERLATMFEYAQTRLERIYSTRLTCANNMPCN